MSRDNIPECQRAHNRPAIRRDSYSRLKKINIKDNSLVEVIDLSLCGKNDSVQVISSDSDDSFTSFRNSSNPKVSNTAMSDIVDEGCFSEAVGGLDLICDKSMDKDKVALFNEEECAERNTSISPISSEEPESSHYSVKEFDLISPGKEIEEMENFKIVAVNPSENKKREKNEAELFQNTNLPDFAIVKENTSYVEGNYDLEIQEVVENKKTEEVEPFLVENPKSAVMESTVEIPMISAPQGANSCKNEKRIELESFHDTNSQDVGIENKKTRYVEGVDNKKTGEVETFQVDIPKYPTKESMFEIRMISASQDELKSKTELRNLISASDIWNDITVPDANYQTPTASFKLSTEENRTSFRGDPESFEDTNLQDVALENEKTSYVEEINDLDVQEVDNNNKTGEVERFEVEIPKHPTIEPILEIPTSAPQDALENKTELRNLTSASDIWNDITVPDANYQTPTASFKLSTEESRTSFRIDPESFEDTNLQDVALENEKTSYVEEINDLDVQEVDNNKKTGEVERFEVEIPTSAPQDALKNKTELRNLTSASDIWNDITVPDTDYQTPSTSFKLLTEKKCTSFRGDMSLNAISDSILNISDGSSIPSPVYEDVTDPDFHMSVDEVDFLSAAGSDRRDLASAGDRETNSSYFTAYSKALDDNLPSISFEQYRTATDLQSELEELDEIKSSIRETSFESIMQDRQNSFSGIAASAEVTDISEKAQKKFASKLPVKSSSRLIKPPKLVFEEVAKSSTSGKPVKKAGNPRLPKATSAPKLTETPRMPKATSVPKPAESPRLMRSTSVTKHVGSPCLPKATSVSKLIRIPCLHKPAESPRLMRSKPVAKSDESPCLPKATSVPKLVRIPCLHKSAESPRLAKAASMPKPAESPRLPKATSVPKLVATPHTPKPAESPSLPRTASAKPNKSPHPAKASSAQAEGLKMNFKTPLSKIPTASGSKIPTTLQIKALSSSKKNNRFGSVISPIRAYITGAPIVLTQNADSTVSSDQASKSVGKSMKLNVAKPSTITKRLKYNNVKEGQENVDPAYTRDTLPPRVFEHANAVFMKDSEHTPKHLPKIGENLKKMISPTTKITVHQGRVKDVPPAAKGVLIPQIMIQSPSPLKPTMENCHHEISIRIQKQCDL